MRFTVSRAVVGVLIGLGLAMATTPAHADWLRAESERFIVYSEGGETSLRNYVRKLEMFDRIMRFRSNLPLSETPPRKLPIYLVSDRTGLLKVRPSADRNTVGIYLPSEEDIFAIAIRRGVDEGMSGDDVLLHEYAHHFMLGNMPGAYPAWFVEGFAEYYMTADIKENEVLLGGFNQNRAYWIMNENWIPLETLLRSRPGEVRSNSQRTTYYPIAWLLTHWFISDETRVRQLQAYVNDVADGADPVEAMESATGMSLADLRTTLRRYTRERLTATKISGQFPEVPVTITRLPRSANDLLLLNQRLKIGVPNEDREALGQEVARIAARHGDDPLALLAAGHAGLHFGDRPAGERALLRLIEIDPNHVEALQFLAQERLRQARDAGDEARTLVLKREARAYLARAYSAGDNDYQTLALLIELRQDQADFPSDNDMLTLGLALDRAPQLASVRFSYAFALAERKETTEAVAVLRPLTNNPHGGGASEFAGRVIAALEAGEPLPGLTQEAEAAQINEGETSDATGEESETTSETEPDTSIAPAAE